MTVINIVSGFLGAGKTTLIKKLLQESFQNEKVVLIENEFGEIGIDSGFLKDAGVDIKEMNSGCICCSLTGDFTIALKEVIDQYHPDRIIIEPSGVGKLSDVKKAVEVVLSEQVKMGEAITIVDVAKCKTYLKNFGEFYKDQVIHSQAVVFSRVDFVSEDKIQEAVDQIRALNDEAVLFTTSWDLLNGNQMVDLIQQKENLLKSLEAEMKHNHEHHEHHGGCCCSGGADHTEKEACNCKGDGHHHHDEQKSCGCGHTHHDHAHHDHDHAHHDHAHHDHAHHSAEQVFDSIGFETVRKFDETELKNKIQKLEQNTFGYVLRAKGMLMSKEHDFWHFDYVPGEVQVRKGSAENIGKMCVIGTGLDKDALKKLFLQED